MQVAGRGAGGGGGMGKAGVMGARIMAPGLAFAIMGVWLANIAGKEKPEPAIMIPSVLMVLGGALGVFVGALLAIWGI